MMACCKKPELVRDEGVINERGYAFSFYLTYCCNCGKVRPSNSGIKDGKSDNGT